jgi:CrcB protein
MLNYILIGPVSAIGGVSPYGACGLIAHHCGRLFPLETLFVNVTGSFVIGFATVTAPEGRWIMSPSSRDFFMTGICGGYTTFSSCNLQTLNPTQDEVEYV